MPAEFSSSNRQVKYEPDDPSGLPWGAYESGELVARSHDFHLAEGLSAGGYDEGYAAGYDDGSERRAPEGQQSSGGFVCSEEHDCVALREMRDQAMDAQRILETVRPSIVANLRARNVLNAVTGMVDTDELYGPPDPWWVSIPWWLRRKWTEVWWRVRLWPWRKILPILTTGLVGFVIGVVLEKFST